MSNKTKNDNEINDYDNGSAVEYKPDRLEDLGAIPVPNRNKK